MTSGSAVPGVLVIGNALMTSQGLGHDLSGNWLHTQLQAVKVHGLNAMVVTLVTAALEHEHGEWTMLTHAGHFGEMDVREVRSDRVSDCAEVGPRARLVS